MLGMRETIKDLEYRINEPDHFAASGKLTRGILNQVGAKSPMTLPATIFNQATEKYYRTTLRNKHVDESFDILSKDITKLDRAESGISQEMRSLLHSILQEKDLASFLKRVQVEAMQGKAATQTMEKVVYLILVYVYYKKNLYSKSQETNRWEIKYEEAAK
jgi:hypothetical protein